MSANKYRPHVCVIPEDDANRQLVDGFLLHESVADIVVEVRAPADGWPKVLEVFKTEYLPLLRKYPNAHVVMLIDFDDAVEQRRNQFQREIAADVESRVFVIGSRDEPETLKANLRIGLESLGRQLAQDCLTDGFGEVDPIV